MTQSYSDIRYTAGYDKFCALEAHELLAACNAATKRQQCAISIYICLMNCSRCTMPGIPSVAATREHYHAALAYNTLTRDTPATATSAHLAASLTGNTSERAVYVMLTARVGNLSFVVYVHSLCVLVAFWF